MQEIHQAIALNRDGAAYFAIGDTPSALTSFREAITVLSIANIPDFEGVPSTSFAGCLTRVAGHPSAADDSGSSQAFYVWKDALVFTLGSGQFTASKMALLCAVIEFNLALLYHLKSLEGKDTGTSAINLYDVCLKQAEQATDCDDACSLLLAVLNNKAHLLGQQPGKELETERLLAGVVRTSDWCFIDELGLFHPWEIQELHLNAMLFGRVKCAVAA